MRDAAIAIIREIGVDTGGSNIQFAVNPDDGAIDRHRDEPARVALARRWRRRRPASRSRRSPRSSPSATRSTRSRTTSRRRRRPRFEPSIDYVVTKIPRFTFEKFPQADSTLTTQMKSVGEVDGDRAHLQGELPEGDPLARDRPRRASSVRRRGAAKPLSDERCWAQVEVPKPERPWAIAELLRRGVSVEEIHRRCGIDPWFLRNLREIVETEQALVAAPQRGARSRGCDPPSRWASRIAASPRSGAPARQIVRELRHAHGVRPVYKRVDTCGAEFEAKTPYLYSTYEQECEATPTDRAEDHDPRRRAEPHRPGHRVRLLLRARGLRAARRGLRDDHGQLQPGDGLDRLRHQRPALLRAADARGRAGDRRSARSRTA